MLTTAGAKRPIYFYNADYWNINWVSNYYRPGYHQSWSFADGAQNDIFVSAADATNYTAIASPTSSVLAAAANVTVYPLSTDLALNATATASSYAVGQPPSAAIDGVLGGYDYLYSGEKVGNPAVEWSSSGQAAGAWLELAWAQPVTIGAVILYDRPNLYDHCYAGTLQFSDGSVSIFGDLNNDGTPTAFEVPIVSTTSLNWTCTWASGWTGNVGLSEIQVYAPTSSQITTQAAVAAAAAAVGPLVDIALNAVATASSFSVGQPAAGANDGYIGGYVYMNGAAAGNLSAEWVSNHQGAGAWLLGQAPSRSAP